MKNNIHVIQDQTESKLQSKFIQNKIEKTSIYYQENSCDSRINQNNCKIQINLQLMNNKEKF